MIQNEGYIEFDLKALFFYILRQWKISLILGLVVALVLGSFMAYSEYATSLTVDMENSYWIEYQQYQDQKSFYEDRISTTEDKIDALQDYIDNSILMKTDHRNVYIAKSTYYVDSGYMILPENVYQEPDKTYTLAWHYSNYLNNYSTFEEIGAQLGISAKYLMEIVNISLPNECTINISISHPEKQQADIIMAIIQKELQNIQQILENTVAEHTITLMVDTCGVYIDTNLQKAQQDTYEELLELQDNLLSYKDDLYTWKKGPAPGELNIVTAFVKWFILGGVIGVILGALYVFIKSILQNRLHSTSQLTSSYQVVVLGEAVCSKPQLSLFSKKINQLEGCLFENSDNNDQFLAENIRNHCGVHHNILVCCDADPEICNILTQSISKHLYDIQLIPTGHLTKDASALRTLASCDAVLMVAARDISHNEAIRKTMKLVQSYKKEIIGFVLTY